MKLLESFTFPFGVEPLYLLWALILISVIGGAILYRVITARMRASRLRKQVSRGAKGEERAKQYLLKNGFTILEEQASRHPTLLVDGERRAFSIRADFLVSKKGRIAIVDAKTGKSGSDPCAINVRRQLFEYLHCYKVDDVYLYDADHSRLLEIRFQSVPNYHRSAHLPIVIGFVCGCMVTIGLAVVFRII